VVVHVELAAGQSLPAVPVEELETAKRIVERGHACTPRRVELVVDAPSSAALLDDMQGGGPQYIHCCAQ
jgi:hypothetical protein